MLLWLCFNVASDDSGVECATFFDSDILAGGTRQPKTQSRPGEKNFTSSDLEEDKAKIRLEVNGGHQSLFNR